MMDIPDEGDGQQTKKRCKKKDKEEKNKRKRAGTGSDKGRYGLARSVPPKMVQLS